MGADLYIKKRYDAAYEKLMPEYDKAIKMRDDYRDAGALANMRMAQKSVERIWNQIWSKDHYFRDCYNGSGLFYQLGISWWKDFSQYLNDKSELTPDKAREVLELVKSKKIEKPTVAYLKKNHCKVDDKNTPEIWQEHWTKWKEEFEAFLTKAIEENTPIYCSI